MAQRAGARVGAAARAARVDVRRLRRLLVRAAARPPRRPRTRTTKTPRPATRATRKLVADKLPLTTDRNGAANVTLKDLPPITRASELVAELTFNDPNGEVQTVSHARSRCGRARWCSACKTGSWASSRGKVQFQALALDTDGQADQGPGASRCAAGCAQVISTRKRMVGGFYAYDNQHRRARTSARCAAARPTTRGLLLCEADAGRPPARSS